MKFGFIDTSQQYVDDINMFERIEAAATCNEDLQVHKAMGSTELAANLFRATQTEEKLKRDGVKGEAYANQTHHEVGAKVRQTIQELGGTMPEDLPCCSIGQVECRLEEVKHG